MSRENKTDLLEAASGYRARNERIQLVVSEGIPLTARDSRTSEWPYGCVSKPGYLRFPNSQSRVQRFADKQSNGDGRLTHIFHGHIKSVHHPLYDIRVRSIASERTLAIKDNFHHFGVGQNYDCPIQDFDL